jgi:hypothetical protein
MLHEETGAAHELIRLLGQDPLGDLGAVVDLIDLGLFLVLNDESLLKDLVKTRLDILVIHLVLVIFPFFRDRGCEWGNRDDRYDVGQDVVIKDVLGVEVVDILDELVVEIFDKIFDVKVLVELVGFIHIVEVIGHLFVLQVVRSPREHNRSAPLHTRYGDTE